MYLFVYGTLLSNIPSSMSKFLRRRATLIGKATTAGQLFDLGMYPGFVGGGAEKVTGELYRLEEARQEQTIEMLDAYESVTGASEDEYHRIEVEVQVGGGGTFSAQTYEYLGNTTGKERIPRGDYPAYYAAHPEHEKFVNGE
ncbi:MAG: gamma-glutamylcyclotransferase family protein [Bacteroidota bacterium]